MSGPGLRHCKSGTPRANLTIAFEGAGKGLDPQGNRFDVNGLKSDEVLEKAIEESGLKDTLPTEELKRRIYILPAAESDTLKELLTLTTINGKTEDIKERMVLSHQLYGWIEGYGNPFLYGRQKAPGEYPESL